ncbi:MAG: V-type ATPase subunit [Lachnoclostridium edouardi]|uniref:V0D/AC39 family V-type ATPase subunit n=1 Tax=Lachnoclostridium edouardi TaxID=1926283 RepID=UPI0026DAE831|nr:V-type ATPase subunit [Lachnoclostridium edouardi]MDO4278128.1 V-type ATPase subunit [Lachnoclostridium edouardi]
MSDVKYTYAVARIRAMETALFSTAVIEQMLAVKDYEASLQFLTEKGWGDSDTPLDMEAILSREREKTWDTVRDLLKEDKEILDVLSYQNMFHNLKAAIKAVSVAGKHGKIYFEDCPMGGQEMEKIVSEKNWSALPDYMKQPAKEAYETFLHTRDGQLCDVIVDRAALDAVYEKGKKSKEAIVRDYAESTVAVADIKIAVRSSKTGKSLEFMRRAIAPCSSLSADRLSQAALGGVDAICEYLEGTSYAGGAEALKESSTAFERWCDNQMMETIKPQKYNAFSAGPLVAYLLARENEIKTVRIILTGKLNGLSEESIRERIREMYV